MSDELKNISPGSDQEREQKKMLQYLNLDLPDAEQHAFEKQLNEDEFMNDAVEGLQQLENKSALPVYIQQLNADLKKQLDKKKKKKEKRKLPSQFWTYISIILLLILVMVAWFIIRRST